MLDANTSPSDFVTPFYPYRLAKSKALELEESLKRLQLEHDNCRKFNLVCAVYNENKMTYNLLFFTP